MRDMVNLVMAEADLGLLELGSSSAKFHRLVGDGIGGRTVETSKVRWRISYRVYQEGDDGSGCIDEIISSIVALGATLDDTDLARVFCVATGVFRDMSAMDEVQDEVMAATGVRVRLLSGADEARLMALGLRRLGVDPPVLACDLGGSSMEWAYRAEDGATKCGSLALGAIRSTVAWPKAEEDGEAFLREGRAACQALMDELVGLEPKSCLLSGGTARTAAAIAGAVTGDTLVGSIPRVVTRDDLHALLSEVVAKGPPPMVKEGRREIFAAGLLILDTMMAVSGATQFVQRTEAVRDGLVVRLLRLLEERQVQELETRELMDTDSIAGETT